MAKSNCCFELRFTPMDQKKVTSLQDLCRSVVIKTLTLQRMQQVNALPLPTLLRDYISTFHIPHDFNLDGVYMDYNFNFPNHVHHKNHQIHPGMCILDNSHVLIKSHRLGKTCKNCKTSSNHSCTAIDYDRERQIWIALRHDNMLNCFFAMFEPSLDMLCYVFEFPLLTLQDYAFRLRTHGVTVPEILVWQVLFDLTNVLTYVLSSGANPCLVEDLCQPQHITINEHGQVKLENLLLYLPVACEGKYQNGLIHSNLAQLYTPPERVAGHPVSAFSAITWGLGCVLYELTSFMPSDPTEYQTTGWWHASVDVTGAVSVAPACCTVNSSARKHQPRPYSEYLCAIITACLRQDPRDRPSINKVHRQSTRALESLSTQRGQETYNHHPNATNLLHLLPANDAQIHDDIHLLKQL